MEIIHYVTLRSVIFLMTFSTVRLLRAARFPVDYRAVGERCRKRLPVFSFASASRFAVTFKNGLCNICKRQRDLQNLRLLSCSMLKKPYCRYTQHGPSTSKRETLSQTILNVEISHAASIRHFDIKRTFNDISLLFGIS